MKSPVLTEEHVQTNTSVVVQMDTQETSAKIVSYIQNLGSFAVLFSFVQEVKILSIRHILL